MRTFKVSALTTFLLLVLLCFSSSAFAAEQHIYDGAGLLSEPEVQELEALAEEHSRKHDTDFLFLTTESTGGSSIVTYMGDFFDDWADTNGQENAVLLTIDIGNRDVYLAGFGTAQRTLDSQRIELVLDRIMPEMSAGDYGGAFHDTVTTASRYMEFRPGVNPENIFFKNWFQAALAVLFGAVVVGVMLFNTGGRVTTTPRTYFDDNRTRVRVSQDRFRNKTVTRRKKPQQSSGGGGGGFGGGGSTGGGRSFSGGGRKF